MTRGIIAGKFVPPHLGHSYMIEQAAQQCDQLTVLICDRPEYLIPVKLRQQWLQQLHPSVTFTVIKDTLDDNDSAAWAANTLDLLGYKPDYVFSSEEYGTGYATHLGAKHVMIDQSRLHMPISGTKVREDPWANWQYLAPIVRSYFARRICLVGSESSGTTTLTRALAEHYQTNWVAEYGRDYTIHNQLRLNRDGWKTKDFVRIARTQNKLEDAAATASNKLLFCDTDSFATSIWHERYMGVRTYEVETLAAGRPYDIYLLTNTNIPFEDDGTRDGEQYRQWMQDRFEEKLRFWGKPYVLVSGTPERRLKQAITIIDRIIANQAVRLPGLVRNNWHNQGGF
jgi:HTH-type transcriptional repressor of NAD biosynthesis genes